jgi:hypothetical protein
VKEGTEADPLKARAASAYTAKILAWYNARFHPPEAPEDKAACEQMKKLVARSVVTIAGDRTVSGYSFTGPTGNAAFDERVRAALDSARGETLPPPPPLYPDLLNASLPIGFSGQQIKCE